MSLGLERGAREIPREICLPLSNILVNFMQIYENEGGAF